VSSAEVLPAAHGDGERQRRATWLRSLRRSLRPTRVVAFVLGTLWLCVVLFPIYYMVLTSFRSQTQYLTANPWLPTGGLSLSSWANVFSSTGLLTDFVNSLLYTAGTIILVVVLSLLAAFRIVRHSTRMAPISFRVILFGLAVPIQAVLIPHLRDHGQTSTLRHLDRAGAGDVGGVDGGGGAAHRQLRALDPW
jgi:raffinose/stachyose/melibiose transport system permease protein